MPVSMEIDWAWGVVEFRVSGPLTPMAIVDGFALLNASPQVAKLRGIVWDVREADLSKLDEKGLSAALKASPIPGNASVDFRIAAVTDPESGQDVGAVWIEVGKTLDYVERRLFQQLDQARAWVKDCVGPQSAESARA